jgi:hypothetical protein
MHGPNSSSNPPGRAAHPTRTARAGAESHISRRLKSPALEATETEIRGRRHRAILVSENPR